VDGDVQQARQQRYDEEAAAEAQQRAEQAGGDRDQDGHEDEAERDGHESHPPVRKISV